MPVNASGAVSGATAGAQIGTMLMPGLGTLFGGALGGLGGAFMGGGGKKTGFGKAFNRSQFFLSEGSRLGTERANQFGAGLFQSLAGINPLFGALQSRALGDLNDEGRTSRLEEAFQSRLNQQQAGMGLQRSPTSALRTSFAGLQFSEQQRQQSFSNARAVFSDSQPLLGATMGALGLAQNPQQDIGFQQLALNIGQRNQQQNSNLQALQGFSSFLSGSQNRRGTGSFLEQLGNMFSAEDDS